jgi:hypothetical protein
MFGSHKGLVFAAMAVLVIGGSVAAYSGASFNYRTANPANVFTAGNLSHSNSKAREKKALLPHCHSHGSDHSDDDAVGEADYSGQSILDITRSRTGWLVAFCVGLLLAAVVVEQVRACCVGLAVPGS